MRNPSIVVGTDGTDCGTSAVEWAAAEALRRRAPLHIVHAFDWDWTESRLDIGNEYIDVARLLAEGVVSAAHDRARALAPELEIETDTLIGHAAARLVEVSRGAQLLVVGSRGRGGFAGLLLGSVSQRMATHAPCPVVVVRGHAMPDGPVVVGADDSAGTDHVLEHAFEAAATREASLTVVRSYLPVIPLWLADVRPADVDTPSQDADERARLDELLTPWITKYPQVKVDVVLTHDSAAAALVAASATAQLVVIGSHGHGVIGGALLGSAGFPLLHHAKCPVLVVRPEA
ncbi:universal stress protein [Paractinoplanes atraurantiacus]|uniref:Nucleotide-binding universal stress protein, UspA family n=1 Tax=Paractinoplanes atraurantiacus TaxID=1036182 RepID=A0A285JGB6_9ACTN|nr:universal stress protein [Actinoplanes atraurantiacus]SNY59113.1 Nucleotide-binding universal stress protein, UspA family [Actinoplanes atraurantiacus]